MTMNRNIFKYAGIAGIAIGAIAAVIILTTGNKDSAKEELGPEATVEAFYDAVSAGDFATAKELCDTVSMETYLKTNEERWEAMRQADSTLVEIAASLLSSSKIEFISTERDGDKRKVHFLIDAVMGMKKEKTATLKKEGKTWRVETITDRI